MLDEIRLKRMKKEITLDDIASPNMSKDAKVVLRVAMKRSCKDQEKLLKEAASL